MFVAIAAFELRDRLLSRGFIAQSALMFACGMGAAWALGLQHSGADAPGYLTTGYRVTLVQLYLSLAAAFPIVSQAADAVRRDHEVGLVQIVQATPTRDWLIVLARFTVLLMLGTILLLAAMAGYEMGSRMPWISPGLADSIPWRSHACAFLLLGLPNVAILTAIGMCIGLLSANRFVAWLVPIGMVTLFPISIVAVARGWSKLAVLADPIAHTAVFHATLLITRAEMSDWRVAPTGLILTNRILWLTLGAAALALAALLASRRAGSHLLPFDFPRPWSRSKPARAALAPAAEPVAIDTPPTAAVRSAARPPRHRLAPAERSSWPVFLLRTRFELSTLLRSWTALACIIIPMLFTFPMLYFGATSDTDLQALLPVTSSIVPKLAENIATFAALFAIIFAGEMMWRERQAGMAEIIDSSGAASLATLAGKMAAIGIIIVLQLLAISIVGIIYQLKWSAPQIDVSQYAARLFLGEGATCLMAVAFAMLVHALISHRVTAHLVAIGMLLALGSVDGAGVEHYLLRFGQLPTIELSDMNGIGHYLGPALWYAVFWGLVSAALFLLADFVRERGRHTPILDRLKSVRAAPSPAKRALGVVLVSAAVVGVAIFWNTNIRNTYRSTAASERRQVAYERRYGAFVTAPQPRVSALDIAVDLFPESRELRVRGSLVLRNPTSEPIRMFFLDYDPQDLRLMIPNVLRIDPPRKDCCDVHEVHLATPLLPGAEMHLSFEDQTIMRGQLNGDTFPIRYNGSKLDGRSLVPIIGVHTQQFLSDDAKREKRMLPPLRKAPGGEGSLTQGFYSADTDGMRFAATISTSLDQTAVAPGTLVKEWQKGGRRYFRYETAKPIDGDWTVASARYVTVEDRWRDIPIFVHHHPSHGANVPLMIEGMKLGLEYCVNAFGPYQYGELRLAEYPYATIFAATAQPAMISYSETAGFIADAGASRTIARQIVSITAHEVAHQWWGYQVASANRRGAQFLSESLAEYTAHMVVRKRFGAAFARSDVARGVKAYLKARGGALDEQPLVSIDNKTDRNVYYGKGSAALYALWEVVGEEALNKSLARFIREYVGKTQPYPVAEDLMRILKEDLGPERHELIADLFERITLWSFETKAAKSEKRSDGKWRTELTLSAGKAVATSEGAETARPLDQRVPITVYEQDPRSQMRTRFETAFARLKDGEQTVTLATAIEPKFLTVNASRALIQREIDKSTIEVGR